MFDSSFSELVVVCVIALVVLGPQRLPGAMRTLGLWIGRLSRTFSTLKSEIEREIGMDEIRRQLHNEAVMDQIKRLEQDVRGETANGTKPDSHTDTNSTGNTSVVAATAAPAAAPATSQPEHEQSHR